jgi:hypothetical protein
MWGTKYRCTSPIYRFSSSMTLWKKEIWSAMHKPVSPKKFVILCRILNNEVYAKVKID